MEMREAAEVEEGDWIQTFGRRLEEQCPIQRWEKLQKKEVRKWPQENFYLTLTLTSLDIFFSDYLTNELLSLLKEDSSLRRLSINLNNQRLLIPEVVLRRTFEPFLSSFSLTYASKSISKNVSFLAQFPTI